MIEYRVRLADPLRHWFEVDCSIVCENEAEDFELPSWIPGSYLLREYARHVVRAQAFDARGTQLVVEKRAHNVWRCLTSGSGRITLRLTVYALDESVRGAWLDTRRGWFNGPCLFVLPQDRADTEVRLTIEAPTSGFDDWQVATAMTPIVTDARGFGEYGASDYDELLDHPVLLGRQDRVDFEAGGVPHSFVVSGSHDGDLERVAADLTRLCNSQIEFFGAPAPFERYLFLCIAVPDGNGGLEHRASTMLMFNRGNLPLPDAEGVSEEYQRMLSLASHEYFHTWHVKRTKPAAFTPYRLSERNYTRLLWVFEGITSYYQERFLRRSGLIDEQAYIKRVGEQISSVMRVPGRHVQSLADSSFDAWDKLYKPNENTLNAGVSYYSKGALVALALDLEIRARHDSRVTLDQIVQTLWREFGARGEGVPEDGFELLARRLAGDELSETFDSAIRGTEDPPLGELFAALGVDLEPGQDEASLWLGIVTRATQGGVECVNVVDAGPAQSAGLNPRDIIVAMDGRKLTSDNMKERLQRYSAGATVDLSYFRGDELLQARLQLAEKPRDSLRLRLRDNANERALALRSSWLAG